MNKKIILFICCGIILGASLWKGHQLFQTPLSRQQEIPLVTLTLNDSDRIATYSSIPASTVFAALQYISKEQNMYVQTKQYDFGVFVEQIGDKPNTKDYAWIYSVNGKSGTVSSDAYELHSGDNVLWQYMKPIF